jgi:hypothetical protein
MFIYLREVLLQDVGALHDQVLDAKDARRLKDMQIWKSGPFKSKQFQKYAQRVQDTVANYAPENTLQGRAHPEVFDGIHVPRG